MTGLGFLGVTTGLRHAGREADFDSTEFVDFAEAFGFASLANDPRAADTAEGLTHTEGTSV